MGEPARRAEGPTLGTCETYVPATAEHVEAWHLRLDSMEIWSTGYLATPERGARYVVVDDRGFAGVLEVTGRVETTGIVYDGPLPSSWTVRFVETPPRPVDGEPVLAVGPTRERWPRIRRLLPLPLPPPPDGTIGLISDPSPPLPWQPTPWETLIAIDLDGDGRPDLEERARRCDDARPGRGSQSPSVAIEWSRRNAAGWTTTGRYATAVID